MVYIKAHLPLPEIFNKVRPSKLAIRFHYTELNEVAGLLGNRSR